MKYIFVNASMNPTGNTKRLATDVLKGLGYQTINLSKHTISQLGQEPEQRQDDFQKVLRQLQSADVIVIGTPVYWASMSGYLKTFLDRFTDVSRTDLANKQVVLLVQGSSSEQALPSIENAVRLFCREFNMTFKGVATDSTEALELNRLIIDEKKGRKREILEPVD